MSPGVWFGKSQQTSSSSIYLRARVEKIIYAFFIFENLFHWFHFFIAQRYFYSYFSCRLCDDWEESMMRFKNNHYSYNRGLLLLPCYFFLTTTTTILLLLFPSVLLCRSYVITSGTWKFRHQHPIAYEQARIIIDTNEDASTTTNNEIPVLLLNGFGVGTFHQHRLIHELLGRGKHNAFTGDQGNNYIVIYCIDYLGQGKSWPLNCQDGNSVNEVGLRYCGTTWVNQITDFIQNVILKNNSDDDKKKVHIVGNSVGGHLATFVAAQLPHLIESLCLLNPTPVWGGLNLPGWNGILPAPIIPKFIGRILFDVIRDLNTIERFLSTVYANNGLHAFDETLIQQIRACTEGPGGHAAFSSILWSPPISITVPSSPTTSNEETTSTTTATVINNFYDCLKFVAQDNNTIPILLVFGQNDPWCKPALARRMLQQTNSHARYIELTNVGHCPNHEAPVATARILNSFWWQQQLHDNNNNHDNDNDDLVMGVATQDGKAQDVKAQQQEQQRQPLLPQRYITIQESWGITRLQEKSCEEIPLNLVDRLATIFV